jgi:autotransporter-associated beta strand protein
VTVGELKRLSDAKDADGDRMAGRKELEALGEERQLALQKSGAGNFKMEGSNTYTGAITVNGGTLNTLYFGTEVSARARQQVRALYRALGPTKEWAENNYYQLRITEQNAELITVNAFWRDYAAWVAAGSKGGFVSANVAEAHRNFTEMMLALAVLDLPFEAPKHTTKAENGQFTFTAGGPCILFHKEIKPVDGDKTAQGQLLVSQSFFRHGDRYRMEGNEKFEKYVSAEFLTGVTYGANVVVTNPTSSRVKAAVLLQIPQGALPILGSKATDSKQVRLEPYTTQTFEYHFYFPAVSAKAGVKFAHFPVNVGGAAAKPMEFNVVAKLTQVDKASWDYVSQNSTEAEVFAFLEQNNLEALDFERVAWRCKQGDFYMKLVGFMNQHHVVNEAVFRYALLHNDSSTSREWLKFTDVMNGFMQQCGPYLASKLLSIEPIELHTYEHLEYSPLVNQRAHRLGSEWRIANPAVLQQYTQLLTALAHKPQLDAMDSMSVVYYLFLQDRVEEALARFKAVDASKLPTRLQHDYFQCYAAFYEGDVAAARGVASKRLSSELPPRWKTLFSDVLTQTDEIDGKATKPEKPDQPDREAQQSELAATEPGFDFKVEKQTISLNWKNLSEVTLNYYLMDPEFSFSSNPFVSQDAGRFSIIKPNKTATQALPKDATKLDVPLPGEFAKANLLVEVIGAGKRQTQAYHANTLKLTLTENYGRLETRDLTTDKPLPKAYVKVYAKLNNGTVRFFKDGYTDLRGRFDYASLNAPENATPPPPGIDMPANGLDYPMLKPAELNNVSKLAVLVLSDTHGATVKEVDPPGR